MNDTERKKASQYLSGTVNKAIDIIKLLAKQKMTATEICTNLSLNKTTVHRLLYTLESSGLVEQQPSSHYYRIGIELVGICSARANDIEIITEAKPHLVKLVQEINQPVHLGIYEAGNAVYIDKIDVINTLRIYSGIGKKIPVHCSALGKAMLLDRSNEDIIMILRQYGMPAFTNNTITSPEELLSQINVARKYGYSLDNGEHEKYVCCIAAPIYDYRNRIVAAISTASKIERKLDNIQFAPLLIETAGKITAKLGGSHQNESRYVKTNLASDLETSP